MIPAMRGNPPLGCGCVILLVSVARLYGRIKQGLYRWRIFQYRKCCFKKEFCRNKFLYSGTVRSLEIITFLKQRKGRTYHLANWTWEVFNLSGCTRHCLRVSSPWFWSVGRKEHCAHCNTSCSNYRDASGGAELKDRHQSSEHWKCQ